MTRIYSKFHPVLPVAADFLLVAAAYLLSHALRFEGNPPPQEWDNIRRTLPFVIPLKLAWFHVFGLYRGMWRYTSLLDLAKVLRAVAASSISIVLVILFLWHFHGFSRSVPVIDLVLTFLFIGGVRVSSRLIFAGNLSTFWNWGGTRGRPVKNLLLIGAGAAGEKVLRELLENRDLLLHPVGFLDDDPEKKGRSIHGVPVLGAVDDIAAIPVEYDEILIAVPSARGEEMRRIVSACEGTGRRYRTMPGLGELIDGRVSVRAVRDVTLADLLGREEVHLDRETIEKCLKGKRILVTGAGGSIGSELVRQIWRFEPECLSMVEFSEYHLFRIETELRQKNGAIPLRSDLVDIRNRPALERVFRDFRPQVVFHAAAYKHVPLQELQPWEAVCNNVLGSRNVMEISLAENVERFVLVSTDKAVRPMSVMGATKRVAELLVESLNGLGATRFMAVRFGNVLGSSGSVVPLFQSQIEQRLPVTVTHPEMTRFFMTIPEAAQLILQAGAMGEGGEIFILDMGRPVRIVDMAKDLIRLSGLEPERDIPIRIVGLRPGEKIHEELITDGEGIVPTAHKKILVLRGVPGDRERLRTGVDALLAAADTGDGERIRKALRDLLPEYRPFAGGADS